MHDECLYFWSVRCVNRQTRELFTRTLVFDPKDKKGDEAIRACELLTSGCRDRRLVSFRQLFREITDEALNQLLGADRSFDSLFLTGYFEDDAGNCLDEGSCLAFPRQTGAADPSLSC